MYEFDNNYLVEIIKSLCDTKIVTEINNYIIKNTQVNLSLCFPTFEGQQNTIYFVIEGDKDVSLIKIAEILSAIKLRVNYDDTLDETYIMIKCKELSNENRFTERYTDTTPYNPNNLQKIKEFFAHHFSQLSSELETFFRQNQKSIRSTEKQEENPEEINSNEFYDYLKANPKLFNFLKRSPNKIDELTEPFKKRLKEEAAAAKTFLPHANTAITAKH